MNGLVRCKACGYIMEENKLGEICPACGVPKKAFEPYKENISAARKRILDLHLHPIMVHFPQAFAVAVPFFIAGGIMIPAAFGGELLSAAKVLSLLLPLAVLGGAATGLLDAKTRFKKITTPIIRMKMALAACLFLVSCAAAVIVFTNGLEGTMRYIVIALMAAAVACEAVLGTLGGRIMNAQLPG